MAVLKYKNSNGEYVAITNYEVQPLVPVSGTGQSMKDVMSQKAVTDELDKKVNNVDLNGKIIDAISGDSDVQLALNEQVADAINNNDGVKDAIADVLENSAEISGAINSVVAEAIASDSAVTEAVNEAVAEAISSASAVTEAVENVVEDKLVGYYTKEETSGRTELETAFNGKANSEHTHGASAITDFDNAISESVTKNQTVINSINNTIINSISGDAAVSGAINTAVANAVNESEEVKNAISDAVENSPAIASAISESVSDAIAEEMGGETGTTIVESIETVIEKYIYGDSQPSASATVVTTDNLATTLDAYAKIGDNISKFVNDANYVTSGQVDGMVAEAISESETVISAITEVITQDSGVTEAINEAVADQLDAAVSGKVDTSAITGGTIVAAKATSASTAANATTASKLSTDAGNTTTPVYFSNGVPVALSYTIEKSVPSDAVFTDNNTTYAAGNFITITGTNNSINVSTGTTNTTVAVGNHTHDDRYYTESEINNKVAAMSATTSGNASKTITALSESNGVISATYADISIASGNITNFSSAIETVVSTSSTISGTITTVVSNAVSSNPSVSGAIETAVESNSAVTASKTVTDFYTGHNTNTNYSLANLRNDKRLIIAEVSGSTNTLSLSGNSLADGYEIHIIVKNIDTENAAIVTTPGDGGYISVGDMINIAPNGRGEINIISDGTNLYVRGV